MLNVIRRDPDGKRSVVGRYSSREQAEEAIKAEFTRFETSGPDEEQGI